jgi:hypothetical protein
MLTVELLILLANLAVFGLNLKLYTEALKDRRMTERAKKEK